jgi:hypothetical protein
MLRAQSTTPVLGTVSGVSSALAINSNNSAGQNYNAVLNSDSSVSLLQNGAILSGQGCPAFSGLSSGIGSGAVYVDSAHNNIYLAMLAGGAVYAAYETIGAGPCVQGPLLQLTTNAQSNLEINVDPVQGNVYILNSFGAFPDALYILPIASWSASSAAKLNMDYSAQYGPIVIDPSNHQVYVNDLGGSAYGAAGTYSTSGFFVYDPNYSATPANNLQHVVGYKSGGTTTVLNVGTLLDNGTGKLVLINENPSASTVNLAVPITILDTTQFSFFTNTSNPYTYNSDVDITPGAGLSTISATSPYTAIGGADINAANSIAYVFGFNSNSPTTPGMLLEYNLFSTEGSPETVLSSSAAMPSLYSSLAPWNQLTFNPESTELVLSVGSQYGSGALGLTSPLCAGPPFSLTQLFGSSLAPTPLGYAVVNSVSGYTYAIQPASSYPAVPPVLNFVAPPSGCTASTPIQISPSALYAGFPNESYFQNFTATGGSSTGYTWSITFGGTALTNLGLTFTSGGDLSGYPNASGSYSFTVQVTDSLGNTATKNYTLTIYAGISATPATLSAGTVGLPYSQQLTGGGGAGAPFTFSAISGTALSAVGLTLSPGGLISGTPSATETAAPLTIKVADTLGYYTQLNYTLTINSASSGPITINDPETVTVNDSLTQVQLVDVSDPETITVTDIAVVTVSGGLTITGPGSLPAGAVNVAYTATTISANGGSGLYTWSAAGLPAGLSIGASSGTITGTPTTDAGSPYSVTVKVTDSNSLTATKTYILAISALPLTITTGLLPAGVVNVPYPTTSIIASGGTLPYSWTVTGLPPGLTTNGSGVITGTPTTQLGSPFTVVVVVTDANHVTTTKSFSLTVNGSLAVASPATLPAGTLNAAYTPTTITASGGLPPYTWSATGLPTGLSINIASGVISGTPTTDAGSPYSVTVTVEDNNGIKASKTYSLTVGAALTITSPSSLPTLYVDSTSNLPITFNASGGSGGYSWTVAGQPSGLTMSTVSGAGELSGTPAANTVGAYSVTVTVTDSASNTNSVIYSLTVASPSLGISASPPTLTIVQGQSGQTTITFTPVGGYPGPVTLSCTGLPANTSCSFELLPSDTPITAPLTFNGQQVKVQLTIQTDVGAMATVQPESAPTPLRPGAILTAIAFWFPGSMLGVIALRRKRKLFTKNPRSFGLCLCVLLVGTLAGLAGCISGGGFGTYVTPAGTSTVTVVATPGSGSPVTVNIGLTITQQ